MTMPCALRVLLVAIYQYRIEAKLPYTNPSTVSLHLGCFFEEGHKQHSSRVLALVRRLLENSVRSVCSIECGNHEKRVTAMQC